jgi:type II secretory pathway predicted ATPase ExeA
MNLAFFGLQEHPFNTTPDPRFLHFTHGHREALAQLMYGVRESKGFLLLTGEVGTGKTTLVQALLRELDSATAVAYIANTFLPFEGILEYALAEFGIAKPGESHVQRLIALQHFLVERSRAGQHTALILDEAQNLQPETLEQLRLLSNFEMPSEKIIQIVLIGQPELRERLELPQLRQLKQRIGLRSSIRPLTGEETHDYIRTRLRVAGARDLDLFSTEAVTTIAKHSRGIPRLVNIFCDHCLLIAYADQVRRIGDKVVEEAIGYLEEGEEPGRMKRRARAPHPQVGPRTWGLAAVAAMAGLAGLAFLDLDPFLHLLHRGADAASSVMRSALGLLGR